MAHRDVTVTIKTRHGFTPATDAALQLLADRYGIAPAEVLSVRVMQNGFEPFARYQPELMIYPDEKIQPEQLRERASCLLATADRLERERSSETTEPPVTTIYPKIVTGLAFGVYAHGDPSAPFRIGGCTWPVGECSGHRAGLGGMLLEHEA